MSATTEWQPIETAPAGRCLMWVADGGERGGGICAFGTVWTFESDGTRSYRADGHHGEWNITHWMPIPLPPEAVALSTATGRETP